jgi:hypothetical protein
VFTPINFEEQPYAVDVLPFLVAHTGSSTEVSTKFLQAYCRFEELLGIVEADSGVEKERQEHADLLPATETTPIIFDRNDALTYIERTTDLDRTFIANMIAEYTAWEVSQQHVPPGAYKDDRAWADAILAKQTKEEWPDTIV